MKYKIDCLTHELRNRGGDPYVVEDTRTYVIEMPNGKTKAEDYGLFTDIVVDAIRDDNPKGCDFIKRLDMCYSLVIYAQRDGFIFKRYSVRSISQLRKEDAI